MQPHPQYDADLVCGCGGDLSGGGSGAHTLWHRPGAYAAGAVRGGFGAGVSGVGGFAGGGL